MRVLGIDLETYSDVDIYSAGLYAYAASQAFETLLLAYAYDDEPVQIVDIASGEELPPQLLLDLTDPGILKTAFNAQFERTCLAAWLKREMPPEQWSCTMVQALTLGLPQSLADVAETLKLEQQKDAGGKILINYFCKPCKPTKANGGRIRNRPWHDQAKWEAFKAYCKQDVETERDLRKHLSLYQAHTAAAAEFERRIWCLDQHINDRGVLLDRELVRNAIALDRSYQAKLEAEAVRLTGLDNPNSVSQLKQWLYEAEGLDVTTLSKQTVPELLKQAADGTTKRVLTLRQEMSRTSTRKYEAMERAACPDGRARGLLQYYGARTGRWTGRLIQVQNLPQNHLKDLDLARQLLRDGANETIELLYDVPDTLSQLIRTALVPSPGHEFICVDFSAIEARVIAWLAGEQWRLDVFNTHGKIYEASASQMFKVPIEQITKGHPLRQKGKIAELALGFGGGAGALEHMGALKMGLTADELPELVTAWRAANPHIVQYWHDCERLAIEAIANGTTGALPYGIKFSKENSFLFIQLPSDRRLAYVQPRVDPDPRSGRPQLTFMGYSQGRWCRGATFGGRLVENIVQATARDCLAVALMRLADAGCEIAFHVHDEVVIDVPVGTWQVDDAVALVTQPISWAPGLPLRADGFKTPYYKKDD